MNRLSLTGTSCAILAVLACGALLFAGPLDPPAGPVTSTLKTLTEVEPRIAINSTNTPGDLNSVFRISQPGSYYLTGNITGVSGKSGIEIAATNVSIDLCGFTLTGVAGSLHGIAWDISSRGPIRICNGVVTGWGSAGISLSFTSSQTSPGGTIDSVACIGNLGGGFAFPDGSVITNCVAAQNGSTGFVAGNHARFQNCTATANGGTGFLCGFGSTIEGCAARVNGSNGFTASSNCAFLNCTATINTGDGFNSTRSVITSCEASFNDGWGYRLSASTAEGCRAGANDLGGFLTTTGSQILNCQVSQSGLAGDIGISVTGTDNRIEGNSVAGPATCFSVTGTGNLIIRNSASGGTRYTIVGGNSTGPIVTAAGMAVLTNPSANFDH